MKIKKLIIILGCCVITLFSLVFVGCKRNTSKASVITTYDAFIELPSIALNSFRVSRNNAFLPTMYLGQNAPNGNIQGAFTLSYLRTAPGSETETYLDTYTFGNDGDLYIHYGYGVVENGVFVTKFNNLSEYYANQWSRLNVLIQEYDNINDIIANTVDFVVDITYHNITYSFNDIDDTIFSFEITHIKNDQYEYDDVFLYDHLNIITGGPIPSQTLLDNMYNDGFSQGYNNGYNNGYNVGVEDGFGATTPFDVFTDTIGRLLDIELFGDFKISSLFYIVFGLIMLGIVIKVFLGG